MATDLNRVILVGRLTRDPELRRTPAGEPVATLRMGFSTRARQPDGEWGERSNYVDVTLFGARAELAGAHLVKGRRIGIDGRLSWREWTTTAGERRQSVEIHAQDMFFLDARPVAEAA